MAPLPPFPYIPGGPYPRPHARHGRVAVPASQPWGADPRHLRAVQLFDSGYYWESHETWEDIWTALGRSGDDADCVRALIKLAAAGVKARQRQPHGVRIHAERALDLLTKVAAAAGPTIGFDFVHLIDLARWIANEADRIAALEIIPPDPVFPVRLATIARVRQPEPGYPAKGPE